jgi:hypothetical protein
VTTRGTRAIKLNTPTDTGGNARASKTPDNIAASESDNGGKGRLTKTGSAIDKSKGKVGIDLNGSRLMK